MAVDDRPATAPRAWAGVSLLLLASVAGGCLGEGVPGAGLEATLDGPGDTLEVPDEDLPTLGPAVDPWLPDETERVLFEQTVVADDCYFASTAVEAVWGQYVMVGCIYFYIGGILEGSRALRFEADAANATTHGRFVLCLWNDVRNTRDEAESPAMTGPKLVWTFDLDSLEWDAAWAAPDRHEVCVWVKDQAGVLWGPVDVRIVLERDPDWEPQAPVDHWSMPHVHDIPQEGAITLLNETHPWNQPDATNPFTWPPGPQLADKVPHQTSHFVLGVRWSDMNGCPPAARCYLEPDLHVGESQMVYASQAVHVEQGSDHRIYVWESPVPVQWERDDTDASRITVRPWFYYCYDAPVASPPACYWSTPEPLTATVTYRAEAWRDEVDLDTFRTRLGVP